MKIAILTANLGKFDENVENAGQVLPNGVELAFKRWTDEDFPPITGLTPRLQYRIPKLFGWQMFPGYDVYLWLDGSMTLQNPKSVEWFLNNLGSRDMVLFKHPWRSTIKEEVDHVEQKLNEGSKYIVSRYQNGLHKEHYEEILKDPDFVDDKLFASTVFMYRNTKNIQEFMKQWWYHQSRYYTVDQIALTYAVKKSNILVYEIHDDQFKSNYITLTSKHK